MDVITTAITCVLLHVVYISALSLFVPQANHTYYIQDRRDVVSILAVVLYHGIWGSWVFSGMTPTTEGNATFGSLAYLAGMVLTVWAQRVNPYFSPTVKMPGYVVTDGPYQILRHPGYIGFGLMSGGILLIASSFWGAVCTSIYWSILMLRAFEENRLLRR